MIAPTRESLLRALDQETLITARQYLLKQLWRLDNRQRLPEDVRRRPDTPINDLAESKPLSTGQPVGE